MAHRLPYGQHLAAVSDFPIAELHRLVFAELAGDSQFIERNQIERWLVDAGAEQVSVEPHSGFAWRATARAAAIQPASRATR